MPLLAVSHTTKLYRAPRGRLGRRAGALAAVDDVSFEVEAGTHPGVDLGVGFWEVNAGPACG